MAARLHGWRTLTGSIPGPFEAWLAHRSIADLPEEFRVVAALYFVEEFSYQEIAEIVDCPVGTVRSRLHRSRKLLQKALWEQEYRNSRLNWAAERVRVKCEDTTWQAFWRTAVEGESPRSVAEALGMSVGAVHIAKSRVIARLKAVLGELPEE